METVLVTGCGRGIGLEFVRQLLARGDRVIGTTRRPAPALTALTASAGDRFVHLTLDSGDERSTRDARAALGTRVAAIDVLVNNAGMYSTKSPNWNPEATTFEALDADDLTQTLRVNAIGPMLVVREFFDLLSESRRGRIVNMSSLLGAVSAKTTGGDYAYAASKAALNIMTRALAADLAPRGIVVIAMTPGWVRTEMGGAQAELSAEESVRGMLQVIGGLAAADAGRVVDYAGEDQPW